MHDVAEAHGQGGWLAWADAVVLELMSVASGLEIRRRHRVGTSIRFPACVLGCAVTLSIGAQVVSAESSAVGWIAAALPALGFLVMVKIALGQAGGDQSGPVRGPSAGGPHADSSGPDRASLPTGALVPAGVSAGCVDERTGQDRPGPSADWSPLAAEEGLAHLLPAAVAAGAKLAEQGRRLSRQALVDQMRRDGHPIFNSRGSALLRILRGRQDTRRAAVVRGSVASRP